MEQKEISETQLKGVTVKVFWQFFTGWTTIVAAVLFSYSSLKESIKDIKYDQDKTNAIQDIRIDQNKNINDLQDLKIRDVQEQINELKSYHDSKDKQ